MPFSIQDVRLDGCLFGLPSRQDFRTEFPDRQAPDRVDLRPFCTPVEHQGQIRSCTINATVGALEYHFNRRDGQVIDLSRMFVYFNARRLRGNTATDTGAHVREAMGAVTAFGACREGLWPYDPQLFAREPSREAYDDALKHEAIQYSRIAGVKGSIFALAEGLPVVFAIKLPDRCYVEVGANGVMPQPTDEERILWKKDGGHSMLIVGYDNNERMFIVRNSWGQDWGDRGYCKISYDIMDSCSPTDYFWIIGELERLERPGRMKVIRPGRDAPRTGPPASAVRTGGLASIAAKMRADIRSQLEAELESGGRPVEKTPPLPPPVAARPAAKKKVIPAVEGRARVNLPDDAPIADLKVPAFLKAGLRVSYSAGDSWFGARSNVLPALAQTSNPDSNKTPGRSPEDSSEDSRMRGFAGVGYTAANFNFAGANLISIDVRTYSILDVRRDQTLSIGNSAVVGDAVSAGLFWIHPTLLELISKDESVSQPTGIEIERLKYELGKTKFNAVRISSESADSIERTIYDLDTGLLLFRGLSALGARTIVDVQATYIDRRELKIPWAGRPAPDWVGKTRRLSFKGNSKVIMGFTTLLPQDLTLSFALESLTQGVELATITTETDLGSGYPVQQTISDMVCASAMFYPLWISPAALKELRPNQALDDDPVTRFTLTFSGVDGQYATILEKGPLEETTYFYDVNTGIFSGFRGKRPYGGEMAEMRTEVWLRDRE